MSRHLSETGGCSKRRLATEPYRGLALVCVLGDLTTPLIDDRAEALQKHILDLFVELGNPVVQIGISLETELVNLAPQVHQFGGSEDDKMAKGNLTLAWIRDRIAAKASVV